MIRRWNLCFVSVNDVHAVTHSCTDSVIWLSNKRLFFAFVKQRKPQWCLKKSSDDKELKHRKRETIRWKSHFTCCVMKTTEMPGSLWTCKLASYRFDPDFLKRAVSGLSKSTWDLTGSVTVSGLITALYFRPPATLVNVTEALWCKLTDGE